MKRHRITRECLRCGTPFETVPSQVAYGKGKFCSRSCSTIFNRTGRPNPYAAKNAIKAREALRGKPAWNRKDKITLTCQHCGKAYQVHECEVHRSKFCSRACANNYKTTIKGASHPLWTRQLRTCEWCGNAVWVKPAKLPEFRFCSRQCLGSWVSSHCKSPTKPELLVQDALEQLRIAFETEYRIGRYSCDFVLPQYQIVIEVDGDYWHSLPKRKALDKVKDAHLQAEGWTIIRLKEMDIYHDLSKCLIKVSKHIPLLA